MLEPTQAIEFKIAVLLFFDVYSLAAQSWSPSTYSL